MKATGIIRKIDDLGRIVIPKEIRKSLKIREGDPIEIYVEQSGSIILKRYAPFGDIIDELLSIADAINKNTSFSVYITDSKRILAISSKNKNTNLDRMLSLELLNVLDERMVWINKGEKPIKIVDDENKDDYFTQVISPIICDGDILGSIILFSENAIKNITEVDLKILQTATDFLSNQM